MNYIADLINSIFPDPQTALFFIVVSLFGYWIYKQIRASIVENEKSIIIKTEKAIEAYLELDFEIRKVLKDRSGLLKDSKVTIAAPYLSYDILKEVQVWIDTPEQEINYEDLKKIQINLRSEFKRLKLTQLDSVTYKNNGGLTEFIHVYFKTKLSSFIEPLFHTAVILFTIMAVILFMSAFVETTELTERVLILSLLVGLVVFIVVLDLIISEVLFQKRFVHSPLNWIFLVVFFMLNLILVFLGPWFRGIFMIISTITYAYYASTYSIIDIGKNKKKLEQD